MVERGGALPDGRATAPEIAPEALQIFQIDCRIAFDESCLFRILLNLKTRACVGDSQESDTQSHIARRAHDFFG